MPTPLRLVGPTTVSATAHAPVELITLIKKMRWYGMESEAQRMQAVLDRFFRKDTGRGAPVAALIHDRGSTARRISAPI